MHKTITSTQNSFIKELIQLKDKSRARKKKNLFLIEGIREISLAVKGNYNIEKLLFNSDLMNVDNIQTVLPDLSASTEIIEVSNDVYKKIAFRETTEGVIAISNCKNLTLNSIKLTSENPLILVAEAPEKPGNIGALLRTADAANIDAVIISNPKTDMYNPNIIRSSVGCVFTTQIATGNSTEVIDFLQQNNINVYGAALTASVPYDTINYKKGSAIVVGTEATGLSDVFLENTSQNIIIPMRGEIDSMNVSVSAAIIIFEAVRQRKC